MRRGGRFTATVLTAGINPYVDVPARVSLAFERRGHVPVKGTVNGASFYSTLVPAGGGRHRLYLNTYMRRAADVDKGDTVAITLRLDTTSRANRLPFGIKPTATAKARSRAEIERPLWTCPKCGNRFVTRNMAHSCVRVPLERHFERTTPIVRRLFDRFRELIEQCGPVAMIPQKTRIVFMDRVRFASCSTARTWLDAGLWLTEHVKHPALRRVQRILADCYLHAFRFERPEQMDRRFVAILKRAYAVGRREHLLGEGGRGKGEG